MGSLTLAQEYVFVAGDYKAMRWNPMATDKNKGLLEQFGELSRFKSFQRIEQIYKEDTDKVVKYLLLCYDAMSPACTQIADIFKRKSWCGLIAGFPYDKSTNVFTEKFYKVMNGEVQEVNYAIIDFCSMFRSHDYMLYVTLSEAFYRKIRTMSEQVEDDKKDILTLEKTRGELYKQLRDMQKDLTSLSEQFLNDKSPYLKEDLYRISNEEVHKKLGLTPERRAIEKGLMKDES